jgi:ABC-type glycerol-3-phosphate transport system permease component
MPDNQLSVRIGLKRKAAQGSAGDKVFIVSLYLLLTFALVIVLLPVMNIVACSLSDPSAIRSGTVWILPVNPTLRAYEAVITNSKIVMGFINSLFYMVFGTIINLAMTLACAYPLSRKEFFGRTLFTGIFVFTMYFGGGLVPTYMVINYLGLIDSRLAMLIPGAMSVWFVIIARTFLQTNIPDEMFEAAKIDGCGEFKFFIRMIIPLSGPVIAVLEKPGQISPAAGFTHYFNHEPD